MGHGSVEKPVASGASLKGAFVIHAPTFLVGSVV